VQVGIENPRLSSSQAKQKSQESAYPAVISQPETGSSGATSIGDSVLLPLGLCVCFLKLLPNKFFNTSLGRKFLFWGL
jgi:hypothetical protein